MHQHLSVPVLFWVQEDVSLWLFKSEPEDYSLQDLEKEGVGCWDGVRNAEVWRVSRISSARSGQGIVLPSIIWRLPPPHVAICTCVSSQARNFMRDRMKVGHQGFFYHSNCPDPAIVGIVEVQHDFFDDWNVLQDDMGCKECRSPLLSLAPIRGLTSLALPFFFLFCFWGHALCVASNQVVRAGYPDHTAFDRKDKHFDAKSDPSNPKWYMVDVQFIRALKRPITLQELRLHSGSSNKGKRVLSDALQEMALFKVWPWTGDFLHCKCAVCVCMSTRDSFVWLKETKAVPFFFHVSPIPEIQVECAARSPRGMGFRPVSRGTGANYLARTPTSLCFFCKGGTILHRNPTPSPPSQPLSLSVITFPSCPFPGGHVVAGFQPMQKTGRRTPCPACWLD